MGIFGKRSSSIKKKLARKQVPDSSFDLSAEALDVSLPQPAYSPITPDNNHLNSYKRSPLITSFEPNKSSQSRFKLFKPPAARSKSASQSLRDDASFQLKSFRGPSSYNDLATAQLDRPSTPTRGSSLSDVDRRPNADRTVSVSQFRQAALRSSSSSLNESYTESIRSATLDLELPVTRMSPSAAFPSAPRRSISASPSLNNFPLPERTLRSASVTDLPATRTQMNGFTDEPESLELASLSPPQPAFSRPSIPSRHHSAGPTFLEHAANSLSASLSTLATTLPDGMPSSPQTPSLLDLFRPWQTTSSADANPDDEDDESLAQAEPQQTAESSTAPSRRLAWDSQEAQRLREITRLQITQANTGSLSSFPAAARCESPRLGSAPSTPRGSISLRPPDTV